MVPADALSYELNGHGYSAGVFVWGPASQVVVQVAANCPGHTVATGTGGVTITVNAHIRKDGSRTSLTAAAKTQLIG